MNIEQRFNRLATHGDQNPYMIVLHDTVSGNLQGTENYLKAGEPGRRGLGYHFMIDRSGNVFQYGRVNQVMWHALGFNKGTVGIAFIGGGGYGEVNDNQWESLIDLINNTIKYQAPGIVEITGHKHCSPGRKHDPQWPGEPNLGVDLGIDTFYMEKLGDETGLKFVRPRR